MITEAKSIEKLKKSWKGPESNESKKSGEKEEA